MDKEYNFVITSKEDTSEAVKHLSIKADSPEIALAFAQEELDAYRLSLSIVTEEFK